MSGEIPQQVFGLLAALGLGALIGLERQYRKHPAGLHTNALVALGAAAFVLAGTLVDGGSGTARVAGQVITGVGFLCAGVIFHQGATVRGLNTAATAWCSAAVGVMAGFGHIAWSAVVAALVLGANIFLHLCEHRFLNSEKSGK